MKTFNTNFKWLGYVAATVAAAALAGCAGNSLTVAATKAYNMGQPLPEDMRNRHLAGWVGFDEAWVETYNIPSRSALYSQGVHPGTPEYQMRVARINLSNSAPGMLWMDQGRLGFATGAMVPDTMRQLRAGDIVEVRQTDTWDTMKGFTSTGEGNVVVRILCSKGDPGYDECLEKAPRVGRHKGFGETKTPYPTSVKDYGFTFTPMYDTSGKQLRPFPPAK